MGGLVHPLFGRLFDRSDLLLDLGPVFGFHD
jgi:hypothetical protein